MENESDRSTLFTTRNTERAMVFFTIVGCACLVGIFLHEWGHEKEKWYDALRTVLGNTPSVLASTTLLTIFKEGLDIMFTRWEAYRDERKKKIEEARKAGYEEGYKAAKAENSDLAAVQEGVKTEEASDKDREHQIATFLELAAVQGETLREIAEALKAAEASDKDRE